MKTKTENIELIIKEIISKNKKEESINKTLEQAENEYLVAQSRFFESINEEQSELFFDMMEKEIIFKIMKKRKK